MANPSGADRFRVRGAALALALLSTLAFWPPALDRWVLPKVLVLGIAMLLALVPSPAGRLPRWLLLVVAGGAALLIVSALVGAQPLPALLGRWPRYEGLVSATAYLLALLLGARLLGPASGPRDAQVLDRVLAIAATLLAAISLLEAFGLRPLPSDLARPGALLGNATDQGAVAAAIAVVLLARVLRTRHGRIETMLLGAAAALAALTVILSGSRAALLALVAGIVVATVLAPAARRMRVAIVAASVGSVAVLALLIPTMGPRVLGFSPLAGDTIGDRVVIWSETLRVAAAHPVLGVGPSGFLDAVAAVHDSRWFTSAGDTSVLDSPHDVLLQALVIGGPLALLGLIAVLVVLAVTIVRRFRAADADRRAVILPAALGAGVLLLVLLTHVSAPATIIPAALLVGAAVAVDPGTERRRVKVALAVPVLAWVALVSVTLAAESALASGVAAANAGRVAEAEAAFGTAVQLRPWDRDTPLIAAEALTARAAGGDAAALDSANNWATRALVAAPGSLAAGKSATAAALASGDLDRAAEVLDDLRSRYPLDPWVAHRAGAVALGLGDFSGAESLLTLATELDPDRPDPWLTLAFLYQQTGDQTAAADAQARADALSG